MFEGEWVSILYRWENEYMDGNIMCSSVLLNFYSYFCVAPEGYKNLLHMSRSLSGSRYNLPDLTWASFILGHICILELERLYVFEGDRNATCKPFDQVFCDLGHPVKIKQNMRSKNVFSTFDPITPIMKMPDQMN